MHSFDSMKMVSVTKNRDSSRLLLRKSRTKQRNAVIAFLVTTVVTTQKLTSFNFNNYTAIPFKKEKLSSFFYSYGASQIYHFPQKKNYISQCWQQITQPLLTQQSQPARPVPLAGPSSSNSYSTKAQFPYPNLSIHFSALLASTHAQQRKLVFPREVTLSQHRSASVDKSSGISAQASPWSRLAARLS